VSSLGDEMTSSQDLELVAALELVENRRARGMSLREHFITYKWDIVQDVEFDLRVKCGFS